MRLLLDSHVALWWLDDADVLGPRCRRAIQSADEVFFSAVTPWELGIKRALGRITFPDELAEQLCSSGCEQLSISVAHAELAPDLPLHHRDPFDRMLVAQAQLESLSLVTADHQLQAYDVELLDATA